MPTFASKSHPDVLDCFPDYDSRRLWESFPSRWVSSVPCSEHRLNEPKTKICLFELCRLPVTCTGYNQAEGRPSRKEMHIEDGRTIRRRGCTGSLKPEGYANARPISIEGRQGVVKDRIVHVNMHGMELWSYGKWRPWTNTTWSVQDLET